MRFVGKAFAFIALFAVAALAQVEAKNGLHNSSRRNQRSGNALFAFFEQASSHLLLQPQVPALPSQLSTGAKLD